MAITLDAITLPDDLIWHDEYLWSPVRQDVKISLSGKLIIQEAAQVKGRVITLSGDDQSAWATRSTIDQLKSKLDTPNLVMTLTHNGTPYNVIFYRSGGNAIDARQVYDVANPDADHIYRLTIKFLEV